MTREEAINEIMSWDFLNGKEIEAIQTLIPELRESEDEEIRQQLLWLCDQWEHNPEGRTIPADIDNIRKIRNWLEKQKESLHISESCKENADSFTIEEERIRKALIDALKVSETIGELKFRLPYPTREECIAYLEKQKEQKHYWKPAEADVTLFNKAVTTNKALTPTERAQLDIIRSKFGYCRAANCSGIVQEEQEPAEVIKDRRQISFMIEDAWRCGVIEGRKQVIDNPEEYGLQKQAEWSEEDEKTLNLLIETLDDNSHYFPFKETKMKMIHLLKSLRSSWKPSEEQMEGLKFFLEFHRSQRNAGIVNWREYDAIESLYEDLKKL